jgi:hypothetical protein
LSTRKQYGIGFISFTSYNAIPNIDDNYFYYDNGKKLKIPTGTYEIAALEQYLQKHLGKENISIKPNNNTLKSELYSNFEVDFTPDNSLHKLLGFSQKKYQANVSHESDLPVDIIKVATIRIECNITTGAYMNNNLVHTLYEFAPKELPGFAIKEQPSHVIYLPVNVSRIQTITLRIVDQDGDLVNLRGELIEVRLELKNGIKF